MQSEQLNIFVRKRNDDKIEFQITINCDEKVKKIQTDPKENHLPAAEFDGLFSTCYTCT